eukprot:364015_1
MSHYDETKEEEYESDDQYQESIVTGNDGRRKVDVFEPKPDDIYSCIGQLDIQFDYNETHMWRGNLIGTGTVIFVGNVDIDSKNKTAVILTCAHNVRCNVIHCMKEDCNTYRRKKDSRGHKTVCKICKQANGPDQKAIVVKATNIKFRDRSIEYGSNYGKTLANYKCTELYVP